MRIIIATHDLTPTNAHLMPWRTVCEVVSRAQKFGCEARLLSLSALPEPPTEEAPSGTFFVTKSRTTLVPQLRKIVDSWPCDAVVWPLVWREPVWRTQAVSRLGVPLIGYLPGGVYRPKDALYAARRIGIRYALPYLAEAVWPKKLQLSRWRSAGVRHLIAMTEFTAASARSNGWDGTRISVIPPGREADDELLQKALPDDFQEWLGNRPYFLFAGPPSGIRGVYELLEAFERVADADSRVCLACLFRSDAPLDALRIRSVISAMRSRDRISARWESVDKPLLEAYMAKCRGIVLPFVTVPSEIPLAIIEAMRFGRPILTTMTGGTGDWVRSFGMATCLGDVKSLANSMIRLLSDENFHRAMCETTRIHYRQHPTWDEMTDDWVRTVARYAQAGRAGRWGE